VVQIYVLYIEEGDLLGQGGQTSVLLEVCVNTCAAGWFPCTVWIKRGCLEVMLDSSVIGTDTPGV